MTLLLVLILSGYCLLLMALLFGWSEARWKVTPHEGATMRGISVVVAFRNEEHNLPKLIASISHVAYVTANFEVILVNDHSTDSSQTVASHLAAHARNVRVLDLPEGQAGKKQALRLGIEASQFDIIVTTDADCTFPEQWLWQISTYFERPETRLLVGAVKLQSGKDFWSRLQALEFSSLVASGAGAIGLNHPVMCNGANLAFLKKAFLEVGGYEGNLDVPSGDDEFLLRKIMSRYRDGVIFMNAPEGVVVSSSQPSVGEFFWQRIRWVGKWKHNSDPVAQSLAVFVLVAQCSYPVLWILFSIEPGMIITFLLIKIILEAVLLKDVARFTQQKFDFLAFLSWQILYAPYVLAVALGSRFNSYRWKDRNYK